MVRMISLIIFLLSLNLLSEDFIPDYVKIFGEHYQRAYFYSDDKQKFQILRLIEELEGKVFELKVEENIDYEGVELFKEKEIIWKFKIAPFTIRKGEEKYEAIPYDKEILRKTNYLVQKSKFQLEESYYVYSLKDKNVYKFPLAVERTQKTFVYISVKYFLLKKDLDYSFFEKIRGEKISFRIIGIKDYTYLDEGIQVYGLID